MVSPAGSNNNGSTKTTPIAIGSERSSRRGSAAKNNPSNGFSAGPSGSTWGS